MFKSSKNEYAVKTCPTDEPEFLEELLNSMSEKGWELYTLHEADGRNGDVVYNCIFYRDKEEDSESDEKDDEIVDIQEGLTDKDATVNFLKDNGFIEE